MTRYLLLVLLLTLALSTQIGLAAPPAALPTATEPSGTVPRVSHPLTKRVYIPIVFSTLALPPLRIVPCAARAPAAGENVNMVMR